MLLFHSDRFVYGNVVFTAALLYFTGVFVNGQLESLDSKGRQGEIEWTSLTDKLRIFTFSNMTCLKFR